MNIFLKDGHIDLTPHIYFLSGIINLPLVLMLFVERFADYGSWILLSIAAFALITFVFVKHMRKRGLYISEKRVYCKTLFRSKEIDIGKVVAIKIARTLTGERFGPLYELKDKNGTEFYMMFLLKEINDEILRYTEGDLRFSSEFGKYIMCRCIYDRSVVNYLQTFNPDVIVISSDGSVPE